MNYLLILLFIPFFWISQYAFRLRLFEIQDHVLIFKRKFPLSRVTRIRSENIKYIFHSALVGKTVYHSFYLVNKVINDNNEQIDSIKLLEFAKENDVTFIHEEGYHGGGIKVLYQSKSKPLANDIRARK